MFLFTKWKQNLRREDLVLPLRESVSSGEMYDVFVPSRIDDEEESIQISNQSIRDSDRFKCIQHRPDTL